MISLNCYPKYNSLLYSDLGLSKVNGFIQIPRGGDHNTTSYHRPSFNEINIHQDSFYDFGVAISNEDYVGLLSYCYLHPHGNNILQTDLLTHAQLIDAGSSFYLNNTYHWYALSIGKNYQYHLWKISGIGQLNWIKFNYEFNSDLKSSARAFTLLAGNLGLSLQYDFNSLFSIELFSSASIPVTNLTIYNLSLGINYKLISSSVITILPKISFGAFRIDNEDSQTIPNHFRYIAYPYGAIGLVFLFH